MSLIASEEQAHRIGKQRCHGREDRSYVVFTYRAMPSGCTVFGYAEKQSGVPKLSGKRLVGHHRHR